MARSWLLVGLYEVIYERDCSRHCVRTVPQEARQVSLFESRLARSALLVTAFFKNYSSALHRRDAQPSPKGIISDVPSPRDHKLWPFFRYVSDYFLPLTGVAPI